MTTTSRPTYTYARPVRSCRHCLGSGCIHCGDRGQVRQRVFTRGDVEAVRLRGIVFGTIKGGAR